MCHKRNFAKACKSMNSPYDFKRIYNCVSNTYSANTISKYKPNN